MTTPTSQSASVGPILDVAGIRVTYGRRRHRLFGGVQQPKDAVADVSFTVAPGEILALVGESGSGKTTIGRAVLGLTPPSAGSIRFNGHDITHLKPAERRVLASELQAIFQNPYGSLNPSLTIGNILTEPLRATQQMSREASTALIADLLTKVGMPPDAAARYPSNFSGGQRQRIAIARALSVNPRLVICDEPTSALDVSTQATVLALLRELRDQTGMSYLFITHDLAVVRHFADRVAVLDHGRIVEVGDVTSVCDHPQNPYTQALVAAAPVPDPIVQKRRREARLAARTTASRPAQPAGSNA
jgi:peptide/nickel transport system ATP-binding protein